MNASQCTRIASNLLARLLSLLPPAGYYRCGGTCIRGRLQIPEGTSRLQALGGCTSTSYSVRRPTSTQWALIGQPIHKPLSHPSSPIFLPSSFGRLERTHPQRRSSIVLIRQSRLSYQFTRVFLCRCIQPQKLDLEQSVSDKAMYWPHEIFVRFLIHHPTNTAASSRSPSVGKLIHRDLPLSKLGDSKAARH